jgi:hypothetical protein
MIVTIMSRDHGPNARAVQSHDVYDYDYDYDGMKRGKAGASGTGKMTGWVDREG